MESSCERVLRMRRSSAPCRSFFAMCKALTLDSEGKKSVAPTYPRCQGESDGFSSPPKQGQFLVPTSCGSCALRSKGGRTPAFIERLKNLRVGDLEWQHHADALIEAISP